MGTGVMERVSRIRRYYPHPIRLFGDSSPMAIAKPLVRKEMRPKATKRSAAAHASEWLKTGAKAAAAIKTGVQLAEVILPYLTPLIL